MNSKKPSLTSLKEYLEVDPTSPSGLRWKKQPSKRAKVGSVAGTRRIDGYWRIQFAGQLTLAHRLVLLLSGVKPQSDDLVADHINRDRSDNRLENLRWATRSLNVRNTTSTNKLGYNCVSKCEGRYRFDSQLDGVRVQVRAGTPAEAFYRGLAKRLEVSWIQ